MRVRFGPACLLVLLALLPGGVAAAPAERGDVHLAVDLLDGSLVAGMSPDVLLTLVSSWGRLQLHLADVAEISFHPNRETATVKLATGEIVRGALEPNDLAIRLPGGGEIRVDGANAVEMRVTPPLSVAGAGDASWDIAFEGTRGWTVRNRDGRLEVSNLRPVVVSPEGLGQWSLVRLGREIEPLGEFDVSADIDWAEGAGGRRAMARAMLTLLDDSGNVIAAVGHDDAWVIATGSRLSQLPGVQNIWTSGQGTAPPSGRARVAISRTGDRLLVSWDGVVVQEGRSAAKVSRVEVQFGTYGYKGPSGPSELGTLTLDRFELEREAPRPPVGVFRHSVEGEARGYIEFLPGGFIGSSGAPNRWTRHGRELVLGWPRADAPGGVWVDRLELSPEGRLYSGRNQVGNPVTGERLERAEASPLLGPGAPTWPLDLLPEGLDATDGRLCRLTGPDGEHYLVNRTAGMVVVPIRAGAPAGNPDGASPGWSPDAPRMDDDGVVRLPPGRFLAWLGLSAGG